MKVTPLTNFRPTPAQVKYANALVDLDVKKTRSNLARACGASEQKIEHWYADPDFGTWIAKSVERLLIEKLADVWVSVHRKATDPRDPQAFEAAKEYIERFDLSRTKHGH